MTQPEALRLADELDDIHTTHVARNAAAELRRLHGEIKSMQAERLRSERRLLDVKAQRDALLEALRKIGQYTGEGPTYSTPWQDIVADLGQTARAAIKAVEEQAEPVPGAWVASPDGRVIYDDASTDDGLLRVSGDFENDEQRSRYAQRIVDKLNAAPPQRKLVPLTEEEIYHATRHCGVSKYTAINITRAVEEASWEKNNGQA